jgi:prepilin-type N-terminal cleavage/methylation domain-containing protein
MAIASRPTKTNAFTLVELLVVIGIIALLISILLPVMNKARESARLTACMSNVRQFGMAMNMYIGEHKGVWPRMYLRDPVTGATEDSFLSTSLAYTDGSIPGYVSGRDGLGLLYPYLKTGDVFFCPAFYDLPFVSDSRAENWERPTAIALYGSYVLRSRLETDPNNDAVPQNSKFPPDRGEELPKKWGGKSNGVPLDQRALVACWFLGYPGPGSSFPISLHKGYKYPVLFGDGHADIGQLDSRVRKSLGLKPDIYSNWGWQAWMWDCFDRAPGGQ